MGVQHPLIMISKFILVFIICWTNTEIEAKEKNQNVSDSNLTSICNMPPLDGPCRREMPRFYYNATQGKCIKFIYGGCKGNENRFHTKEKCIETCGSIKKPMEENGQTLKA